MSEEHSLSTGNHLGYLENRWVRGNETRKAKEFGDRLGSSIAFRSLYSIVKARTHFKVFEEEKWHDQIQILEK